MKVLVLRFSSIGDIVLTTPVIRNLKKGLPNSEVHFATKEQFVSIVESNPYIDKIHPLGSSIQDLIERLKAEGFDLILDLHKNLRTLRIKRALKVKAHSFNKLNALKWIAVNTKKDVLPDVHIVDRYLETLNSLNLSLDSEGLDYFITANDEVDLKVHFPELKGDFYGFVIGGQHKTKILPLPKVTEAILALRTPVILLGGKEDLEFSNSILDSLKHETSIEAFNAVGQFSLNESASIIKQSKGILTNDTGLMHIAAAFQKPVISFWGNTIPKFGMYPYRTRFLALENLEISCRPCSKLGFNKCPKGHFKCMLDLNFNENLESFLSAD